MLSCRHLVKIIVVVVRPALGESVSPEWGEISLHVWEGLGPQSGGRGTLRYRVLI